MLTVSIKATQGLGYLMSSRLFELGHFSTLQVLNRVFQSADMAMVMAKGMM